MLALQAQTSAGAIRRQLQLLTEASFLDPLTLLVDTTMVTYNAQQRVFGMTSISVEQVQAGRFDQAIFVSAVNAAWPSNTLQGVMALALPAAAVQLLYNCRTTDCGRTTAVQLLYNGRTTDCGRTTAVQLYNCRTTAVQLPYN